MDPQVSIQFLGAAGTVTGSKYLVKAADKQILVDCGLFQGLKELRLLNWEYLPLQVPEIDLVLLTHAHLDHTGYLPRLVSMGFKGKILGTAPTLDISEIILRDSAKIQEEDAARANKQGYSRHKPAKPLYDLVDVERTIPYFYPQPLGEWVDLGGNIKVRFNYNGHIIGATFIELKVAEKTIVFSGDIGRENDILLYPPHQPQKADVLVIESTYGNRLHPAVDAEQELKNVIWEAWDKGGPLLIPSFAVERTQSMLFLLWKMQQANSLPDIPIIMDSPMGRSVLNIFHHAPEWHKLSSEECAEMCKKIKVVKSVAESLSSIRTAGPKIVIAGSGMVTGGRVLGYLEKYVGDPSATILLIGYQAEGTRGRQLQEGVQEIKMYGRYFPVRAAVRNVEGLSGHADQGELIRWMGKLPNAPEKLFIVHGELPASEGLRAKIKEVYGWEAEIPEQYSMHNI
ncbi:metallo-beta-lactamase family protein [Pontibacter mucosus]|uniref:Metallo-beta-lactamase family protein n=1 Tax=Pontibacter mucosus TaxID=1649266 RepID=A0A2T5Y9P6_9BACT|nr:MBL fold metallo-hydrolase [Pontibacter mucosus]PTX13112.1 metallo-beta-lactamase family protein [Pontibacter mucosus]